MSASHAGSKWRSLWTAGPVRWHQIQRHGGSDLRNTGPERTRQVGHASMAKGLVVAMATALLVIGARSTAFAQDPSSQPTDLSIALLLPSQVPAGIPLHQRITATGRGIIGCYRWTAAGLPPGLRLAKAVTCVPRGRISSTLVNAVRGTPVTERPSFVSTVTITVEAIGASARSRTIPRPAGSASAMVVVLPPAWDASGSPLQYQGTSLDAISCTLGPTCWVTGTSSNPPPSGTRQQPVNDTGAAPGSQDGTASSPAPIERGTFVAGLVSIKPLRMDLVRVAIPLSVTAMACPAAHSCVLVGSAPLTPQGNVPAVLYMTDAGAVWRVSVMSPTVQGSFSSVACPNTVYCLAVGSLTSGWGFVDRIVLVGSQPRLSPVRDMGTALSGISCANATSCLAVGRARGILATQGEIQAGTDALIEATSDGGYQWHGDQVVGPDGFGGKDRSYEQPWLPTVDGPLMFGGLVGVGCAPSAATNSCVVTWPFWPATASTSDGIHWYPNVRSVGAVGWPGSSVSCPTLGRCFSVTGYKFLTNQGDVESLTDILETIPASPGWRWGIAGQGPASTFDPSLVAISCPTISTCVAVGSWYPGGGSAGSRPVYPLVMAPQLALHPYFRPHPPLWAQVLSWQTLGLVLGAISLMTGVGALADAVDVEVVTENLPTYVPDVFSYVKLPYNFVVVRAGMGVADVVSFLSGALGTGIGAAITSTHDPIGWIAVGLSVIGLSSWAAGLSSLTLSGTDPTAGTSA